MAEEDITEAASDAPAQAAGGQNALGRLQGLFGARHKPASTLGGGSAIQVMIGGKAKLIIPGAIVLVLLAGAIFFVISAVAVYASRLGSIPGYGGGITSGSCPATVGYLSTNDTFDTTGDQIAVTSVPDISQATLTETASIAVTTYCPPRVGEDPRQIEGGQTVSFGIKPGIGNIAVPNDPVRFPLGRTVIDIPGVGLRVATDHGGKIRVNSTKGGDFDVDLFVGYSIAGTSNCDKYSDKWVHDTPGGTGHVLAGAKVYVFKSWDEATARLSVKTYDNNAACQAAHQTISGGSSGTMDFRSVGPGAERVEVGIWRDIVAVMTAVGKPGAGGAGIVSHSFMGRNVQINKYIIPALDKVQADLKANNINYPIKIIGGFNWRHNVNNASKISPHAFGVAIDVNENDNTNHDRSASCRPKDPSCCKHDMPAGFSDAFEKNGFFWGAKFYGKCDSMHFQYGGNYDTSRIDWNGGNIIVH